MFQSDDSVGLKCPEGLGETEEVQVHLMQKCIKIMRLFHRKLELNPHQWIFSAVTPRYSLWFSLLISFCLDVFYNSEETCTNILQIHSFAAFNIKANAHKDESKNIHETTGCKGSQAPNTSRTNRHFEGVTSRFLFVHLNFLPLPNLVRLVKVILPSFLPFAELVQCPAGKSTIVKWNSFNINWTCWTIRNLGTSKLVFNEHGCTQACINKWLLYIGGLLGLAC